MRKTRATAVGKKPGRSRWGAWLGLVALALNALVPVHIAFDLAEALTPPSRQVPDRGRGVEWRVLAFLTGHFDPDGKSDDHGKDHHTDCAVCNSLGTLAGVAPVTIAALPVPALLAPVILAAAPVGEPARAPAAAYRSRAPPLS